MTLFLRAFALSALFVAASTSFCLCIRLPKFKVGIQSTLNLSQFGDGLPDTKWRSQTRSFSRTFFVSVSSRLIAEIQLFLLSVVRSSNSAPCCLTTDGIRKNPWVFPFPLFLPHPTTTHRTILVCLHLRDTNMADSNRCQAVGHVGENQE